jgi:hypothetical protein
MDTLKYDYNTIIMLPKNKSDYHSDLFRMAQIADMLPHGAGIDYLWYLSIHKYNGDKYITCQNSYHAMDESGFYCHIYDFKAKYKINSLPVKKCDICNGAGFRLVSDLAKIRAELIPDTCSMLKSSYPESKLIDTCSNGDDYLFECNLCHGAGYSRIPLFELTDLKVKGRLFNCCGYGLDDYLWQVLYLFSDSTKLV